MSFARLNIFNAKRYRNHHKLVVYRHYIVYFINETKHIEDIAPDIRKSLIPSNFEPDVSFIVDGWKFPAHKSVLKISNEQFYIQHVEPHQDAAEIVIAHVGAQGFQQFLRFCHFGDLNLNTLNMMPTFDVAVAYQHSSVMALSEKFICDDVNAANVLEILDWNLKHQNYQIMRTCRRVFTDNATEIVGDSEKFQDISKQLLKEILGWEVMNCSEKWLFNETLKWAEKRCIENELEPSVEHKKSMLEDIIHLVRLEVTSDLRASSDFPTNSRANRFSKRRFDNLFIVKSVDQTWEELPSASEDTTCFGFSIILSNPELNSEAFEQFHMTIETEHDALFAKEFTIKVSDYLSIKDFVFEVPIIMEKRKRHFLMVKFHDADRLRFMGRDDPTEGTCARLLRLYD